MTILVVLVNMFVFATPEQFIVLQIAPQKYNEEMIPYTIAHEYHHTVYFEKVKNQKRDLIDYVLIEGKADSFANLVIPDMVMAFWVYYDSDNYFVGIKKHKL